MNGCKDYYGLLSLDRELNNSTEEYIKSRRNSFRQDWDDYMDYIAYSDWRKDYGM
jgi:predicted nucleotidyltransferase